MTTERRLLLRILSSYQIGDVRAAIKNARHFFADEYQLPAEEAIRLAISELCKHPIAIDDYYLSGGAGRICGKCGCVVETETPTDNSLTSRLAKLEARIAELESLVGK